MRRFVRHLMVLSIILASVGVAALPANASQPNSTTAVNCKGTAANPCPTPPTQPGGLDHYLCYKALTDQFNPPPVHLQDQFGVYVGVQPLPASAGSDNHLCNPVVKTLEAAGSVVRPTYDVNNLQAHLYCFTDDTHVVPSAQVIVANQFGSGTLNVGQSTRMCLPSWKFDPNQDPASPLAGGSVPPGAGNVWPDPVALNLNHFQCYQVSFPAGGSGFPAKPATVTVQDQFGLVHQVTIGDPKELCAPVIKFVTIPAGPTQPPSDINTDGLNGAHLLCLAVDIGNTRNVLVGNQFSQSPPGQPGAPAAPVPVGLTLADQLCLPSFKQVKGPIVPEAPLAILLPLSAAFIAAGGWLILRRRGHVVAATV